jgi:type III restriction enzyme
LLLGDDFKELWDKIKHRTRYAVDVDSDTLVQGVVAELDETEIRKPRILISKAVLEVKADEDTFEAIVTSGAKTAVDLSGRYPLPNLIEIIETMMEATSPPMRLSRQTIMAILKATAKKDDMLANPHDFAAAVVRIAKQKLADQLVGGIRYDKDGSWYEQTKFLEEIESYADRVVNSTAHGAAGGTHLYDGVEVDSDTIERPFAEALEKRADVKLYIKLPDWFTVDTPVGRYNPDWAVVLREDGGERLFLVRETKGTVDLDKLRPDEKRKVRCGVAHFRDALGVDFQVATDAADLGVGGIAFASAD